MRNVLVVTTDHLRYDTVDGPLRTPLVTPFLDRLRNSGVRFSNCVPQSPVCSPARFSLTTGLYVHEHGVSFNEMRPRFPPSTIGHAFSGAGYQTRCIGHMHWTDATGTPPDFDIGFDRWITMNDWLGTLAPNDLERFRWENHPVTRRTTGGPSPRPRESFWGHHVAKETIEFVDESRSHGRPFFCWASFWEPHPPFYPPADIYAAVSACEISPPEVDDRDGEVHPVIASKRKEWEHLTQVERRQIICGYYGLVALVDSYIGQIIEHLEDIGELENTIIVFTSDHGEQLGEHGLFLKFVMREASLRVPLWFVVPGAAPGDYGGIVEHVDLVPTVTELAGVPLPAPVSGVSLAPIIAGNDRKASEGVKTGGTTERYALSQIRNHVMIRDSRWKLNVYDGVAAELFDLRNDRDERRNLVEDGAHVARIGEMLNEIRHKGLDVSRMGDEAPEGRPMT